MEFETSLPFFGQKIKSSFENVCWNITAFSIDFFGRCFFHSFFSDIKKQFLKNLKIIIDKPFSLNYFSTVFDLL